MKLPSFRRIIDQDYPVEFKKLVNILSVSLNNGIEVLYQVLDKRVNIRDNIQATVKDIVVIVDANGTPRQQAAFALDTTAKVEGIQVILAQNQTNSSIYPTSQPFISGTQSSGNFIIANISGLQENQQYLLRVVAYQS